MRELPLRRHGENFNPIYAAVEGEASWAGRSTDLERPDGQVSGIVKRFKKSNEAAPDVSAIGLIKGKLRMPSSTQAYRFMSVGNYFSLV